MKKVLVKFDGIDIERMAKMEGYKDLQDRPFIQQENIREIERISRMTGKPIRNLTMLSEEEKKIMDNAIKNKINVTVDFKFHGYWENEDEIVMLTTAKRIIIPK